MSSDHLQSEGFPLTGCNILLVEDDLNTKDLLCDLLKFHGGASVKAVTTARAALEMLVQAKPDLLISNIVLPDEDGYALIEQVRKLAPEEGGHIPAIAITASASEKNRTQLPAAGFQAYFFKPFEMAELIQTVVDLIYAKR